jgi:hypothetical protein
MDFHVHAKNNSKMKTLILSSLIAFMACQSAGIDKKSTEIQLKETISLNDIPKASLTFYDVNDSRCPEGVNCVWAGNATVDLLLEGVNTEGKLTKRINMCLGDCRTLYGPGSFRQIDSLDQEFAGQKYRFILENVSPHKKADSTVTKDNYSISLKIEKR